MRSDTRSRPVSHGDPARDPAQAAALDRLSTVLAPRHPATDPAPRRPATDPEQARSVEPAPPWADIDPDGIRPERVPPESPDISAWADPPWWNRIRWAPDKIAGVALVVLVVALGAFSVNRLLASVPEAAPVPDLPLAAPGETVPADGTSVPDPSSAPSAPAPAPASPGTAEPSASEEVVVSVVGLVGRSGLVTLAPGARVADALDSAGGVREGGDRDGLNLARKVVDGEQILVGLAPGPDGPRGPRSAIVGADGGPGPGGPVASDGAAPSGGAGESAVPVNINSADATELETLPGVGPVTASSILAWRAANGSFTSVDQLAEVDGIGPATLSRLRPLVAV